MVKVIRTAALFVVLSVSAATTLVANKRTIGIVQTARADPQHCDIPGGVTCEYLGHSQGYHDGQNDRVGANGHGYYPTCPSHHSVNFCIGYASGYHNGWYGFAFYQPPRQSTSFSSSAAGSSSSTTSGGSSSSSSTSTTTTS